MAILPSAVVAAGAAVGFGMAVGAGIAVGAAAWVGAGASVGLAMAVGAGADVAAGLAVGAAAPVGAWVVEAPQAASTRLASISSAASEKYLCRISLSPLTIDRCYIEGQSWPCWAVDPRKPPFAAFEQLLDRSPPL